MSIDMHAELSQHAKDLRLEYAKSESDEEKRKLFHQIYTAEKKAEDIRRLRRLKEKLN